MPERFAKGLENVIAEESKVCFIDGLQGKLLYRGYNIHDLAEHSSYEEVTYLLLHGRLPILSELRKFSRYMAARRRLSKKTLKQMKTFAKDSVPMDSLRTTVSLLAGEDRNLENAGEKANLERCIGLVAKFPTIVAANYRMRNGKKIVPPKPKLGHAANFLYMLHGREPDSTNTKAMDLDFILHAEHGFNASTFSARVTISTLPDIYSSIVAAIATLKGPLHGGAAGRVFQMLKEIRKVENVQGYVDNAMAKKQKLMGFGHRVYKTHDPRAMHLKAMSRHLAEDTKNFRYLKISEKLESVVVPLLQEKHIYPNVDFYSGTVYNNLGIHENLFNSIFAIGRIPGWCAHVLEQLEDNRIIRPRARYVGPIDVPYVEIERRSVKQ